MSRVTMSDTTICQQLAFAEHKALQHTSICHTVPHTHFLHAACRDGHENLHVLYRFHDVEPLAGLEMMQKAELSLAVVSKSLRTVPYPLLGENTMVLSDTMILSPDEKGRLALMFRCILP